MSSIKATARQAGVLYLLLAITAPFNLSAVGALAQTPPRRPVANSLPAFSPDGRLAVGVGASPSVGIAILAPGGGTPRALPQPPGLNFWPEWSPDGTRIAFTSISGSSRALTLQIVNTDGSGEARTVGDGTLRAEAPAWSPDGSLIAFQWRRDGNTDIYTMTPDGTDLRRITTSPDLEEVPAWSADGRRIAFQSDRSGKMEIWIMNADGTDARQLTQGPP